MRSVPSVNYGLEHAGLVSLLGLERECERIRYISQNREPLVFLQIRYTSEVQMPGDLDKDHIILYTIVAIATPKEDIDMVKRRLKVAAEWEAEAIAQNKKGSSK